MLDEAIRSGQLRVQEKDGGEVNTVRVRNSGKTYVFGMAGEIVSGAKQDRMLQNDILLPPGSGWLDVPVFCTEHGRWTGSTMQFGSKGQMVAGRVRERAAKTASQSEVWAEVDAARRDLRVETPTGAFAKVYEEPTVQRQVDAYTAKLDRVPDAAPDASGVLVAIGSEVVCVDAFGSAELFRKMWPKLLRSYVIDAVSHTPKGRLSTKEAQSFLRTAASGELSNRPTIGAGTLQRIDALNATGSALVFGKQVVHLDLFPGSAPQPEDGPTPQLQFRRQHSRD
jgi:hypothetical protein